MPVEPKAPQLTVITDSKNPQLAITADNEPNFNEFVDLLEQNPTMTITPDSEQASGVEAAVTAADKDQNAGIDAAVAAPASKDNNTLPTLPLRTSRNTLIEFAKHYAEKNKFQNDENIFSKIRMAGALGGPEWNIFSSNDYIIRNMNFNLYWEMRNFQIKKMQEELEELLGLTIDEHGNLIPKEGLAAFLHQADEFIRDPLAKALEPEEKIKYIQQMLEFLEGVHIELKQNQQGQQEAHIKKKYDGDDIDLVTITENTNNGLNNMEFSINPALLADSTPEGKKRLADAIELSIDQATRLLERNQDKKYRLHIEGYEDSPEMVLRMFYSAKLHGHNPTIDEDTTLKFWQEQVEKGTQQEQTRYTKALELYHNLNNTNNLKQLRDYEAQVLAQKLSGHNAPNAPTTPISISKLK